MPQYLSTDPNAGLGDYLSTDPNAGEEEKKGRTLGGTANDIGVTALKGAVGLPQAAVGIADILTGGYAGKGAEAIGIKFDQTQKALDTWYSDAQQQANKNVARADGFLPTIAAALENPSTIATTIGESIPQMIGGAGLARLGIKGAAALGGKVAPWLAGALGEGAIGAGSAAEGMRQESPDQLLSGKQSVAALGSGLGTAAFGAAGGKLANKFGFGDMDTILAQGGPDALAAGAAKKGFLRQVVEGGISEGVFEELPQSIQETMWQNWATDKPLFEGTGHAGAMGMLAGMGMGMGGGGYNAAMQPPPASNAPNAAPVNGLAPGTNQSTPGTSTTSIPPATPGTSTTSIPPATPGTSTTSIPPAAAGTSPFAAPPPLNQADPGAPVFPDVNEAIPADELFQPGAQNPIDRMAELDAEYANLQARKQELNDPANGYGPMFDTDRAEIFTRQMEIAQERAELELGRTAPPVDVAPTTAPLNTTQPAPPAFDAPVAPKPTAAEQALADIKPITALDRVAALDTEGEALLQRKNELAQPDYGPMFDAERAEVESKLAGLMEEREAITKTWPAFTLGTETDFSTEAGARVKARYALAEADQLISSHDEYLRKTPTYPPELQPRERDRAASEMQVSGIFQKLDPARLGESADAANGAPIVGADGLVESGNARTIALKRVYQANGAKAGYYKQFIKDNAARFGLSPEQVDGMRAPVLVRVRTTPVNRAEFARQANAATVAQMSPSEQARADAARMDNLEGLNPDENGDFTTGTSRDFVRRFMGNLAPTERAGLMDASGALSQSGYARIRNAVLAKAYGDSGVLQRMVESLDDNLRNIGKALTQAAPKVAKARAAIQDGALFNADITPDLMAAVEELSRLKESGTSVDDALAQKGMFGEKHTPETRALIRFLADNTRRPRKIADFMQSYFDGLNAAGNPGQSSLLGETQAPSKADLMQAAYRATVGMDAREQADANWNAALADLGVIARNLAGVNRMLPEDTPNLMPTLVKLFGAGLTKVGFDVRDLMRYVKNALKAIPEFKTLWNKIPDEVYRKAAQQAIDAHQSGDAGGQMDMFAAASAPVGGQVDLFSQPANKQPATPTTTRDTVSLSSAKDIGTAQRGSTDKETKRITAFGQLPKPDSFMPSDVLAKALDKTKTYRKPVVDLSNSDRKKAEDLLVPLIAKAQANKPVFDQAIRDISAVSGIGEMIPDIKGIGRAAEKLAIENNFDVAKMKDVLRATVLVGDFSQVAAVVDAIKNRFDIDRIKNRTEFEIPGTPMIGRARTYGYGDVLVNVVMPDGLVAEIQINTPEMFAAKEIGPGHKLYEVRRVSSDIVEIADLSGLMREYYDAAYQASLGGASSRTVIPSDGPAFIKGQGDNSLPSSENLNQFPSGNLTNSSPPNVGTNEQPGGNFSGTFMGSPSEETVPQDGAKPYTGSKEGGQDVNAKSRESSTQRQVPDAVPPAGGERGSGRVRDDQGGGNLRRGGNDDAGTTPQGKVGQTRPGGVRGQVADGGVNEPRDRAGRDAGVPDGRLTPDEKLQEGLAEFGAVLRQYYAKVGGARMLTPEESAKLMPALIKILEALYEKGTKAAKALIAQAQAKLKKHDDEFIRTHWNKITPADYAAAAQQAIENIESRDQQGDLFAAKPQKQGGFDFNAQPEKSPEATKPATSTETPAGQPAAITKPKKAPPAMRDLNALVDRVRKGMTNLPNVHVLSSPDALDMNNPAQARLRNFIEEAGAMEDVEGAAHEGEIYLFASGLADEARAEHVLATHEVTHYGLRAVFGKELDAILQSIWATNAGVRRKAAALRERLGIQSNVGAVEEVLADMEPSELVKLTGWRRLAQVVRDWFRGHGFTALADRIDSLLKAGLDGQRQADLLVADVVNAARGWVKGGKRAGKVASGTALQRVWHGTPHIWAPEPGFPHGRPRLDKIGSGEGAQAYGWGWYSAAAQDVGQSYRDALGKSDTEYSVDGVVQFRAPAKSGDPREMAIYVLANGGTLENAVTAYEESGADPAFIEAFKAAGAAISDAKIERIDKVEGYLYQLDIPDDVLPHLLDWDKPLSQQTAEVRKALAKAGVVDFDKNIGPSATGEVRDLGWAKNVGSLRGEEIYKRIVEGNFGKASEVTSSARKASEKAASEYLASIGIVGNRYLDGQSRNRPLKNIKREFLAELPEDADTSEVADLIGTGKFSPKNDALLRALKNNDWLGFDYPAQAVSAVLSKDISGYDASPALIRAVEDAKEGGTYNYVIWDQPTLDKIALLERNGEKLDATMLSRQGGAAKGIALRDLNAMVDRVRKSMDNLPTVHVLSSPENLDRNDPAQAKLHDYIVKAGAMADVEGATHDGEIYLFASGLADEARAEHVLATHEVTHYGLRAVFGMELDPVLQSIWATNANIRKKSAALRETLGLSSNVAAVEEVLADMAPRDLIKLKGWRRLVGVVRDWLRAHGFTALADRLDGWMKTGLTDQQRADLLVAEVVNAARAWVKGGKQTGKAAIGTALADVRKLSEDLPAQEKWLNAEARARGFKDIDDLAAKDYKVFENLAKLWREKHPADGALLSRAMGDYQKRADQLYRAFAAMGLESRRESSRVSASEYVEVQDPNDEGKTYKFRVSNHQLPNSYAQPDFDVIANEEHHGGHDWNKSGSWIDAVDWIAQKTGVAPHGIAKTLIAKRDAEKAALESRIKESELQRQRLAAESADRRTNQWRDWLNGLPKNATVRASKKIKLLAEVDGRIINGPDAPYWMDLSNSALAAGKSPSVTVAEALDFVEKGAPTPNSVATRLPGAPEAGMQERTVRAVNPGSSEPAQSGSGAGSGPSITKLSRSGQSQLPSVQQSVADRANAIIADATTKFRPVEAIVKAGVQLTRFDRATSALYARIGRLLDAMTPEKVKAGVVADYGVPGAVLDQRAMMAGRKRVQLRKTEQLIEKLATLTRAESRVAYEWMNNDDPQAADYFEAQLPAESVQVLKDVRTMIDQLSQEAVRLGQLDAETFKKHRFAYLRRSYAKHMEEMTKRDMGKRQRAIAILGDQYKGRGMVDDVAMSKVQNVAPEWWKRKTQAGKADKGLKGEKFIRLERRANTGAGTAPLAGMTGRPDGKLLEVAYWPAGEPMPAKFKDWNENGTWEVRDTKGANLVMWRDFTKSERQAMGEIDEARFAIARTLHGMINDVETGRYLNWIADRYGEMDPSRVTGQVVDASERMRDTFAPDEWVKVPDTKIPGTQVMKYGKLAGRFLPGPIWNDVRQLAGARFQPLGETYAAILSAWKTAKTALSPAVHTNNVMANMVMADWHDVGAGHMVKALRILLAASDRDGKGILGKVGNMAALAGISDREAAREILNRFQDSGGGIGTWITQEIQKEQMLPLLEAIEQELGLTGQNQTTQVGAMAALQHLLHLRFGDAMDAAKASAVGKPVVQEARNLIALYEQEDQVFRLASWIKAKEDGQSDLEAGKSARKSFLDYHINAPWVQMMRQTAFPFVAFTYRALPMLMDTAAHKPWKLMKLALLAGGLNALGYALSGGDEDEERKPLPDEKAGSIWGLVPKLIRMPWNDQNGSPVFLDIRRFVPVGDIFDTGQTNSAVPVLPAMVPSGPLALMGELALNKSAFTGKSIVQETDTGKESAIKVMDYLYKAFAPNLVILPGTYAFENVKNAGKGRTDSFGRELSVSQALANSMGMKVGSYPVDVLRLNAQREAQYKLMEIQGNITKLKREYAKSGMTDDEFQSALSAQQEKRLSVMEALGEKTQ